VTAQQGPGDPTTLGYKDEPQEVAAEVAGLLDGWDDPLARYHAATAAQVHHQAVVNALADERARIAAGWNDPGRGGGSKMSYQQIADLLGMSRSKAQQLVERGRTLQRGHQT
jgi:hypothetical protein